MDLIRIAQNSAALAYSLARSFYATAETCRAHKRAFWLQQAASEQAQARLCAKAARALYAASRPAQDRPEAQRIIDNARTQYRAAYRLMTTGRWDFCLTTSGLTGLLQAPAEGCPLVRDVQALSEGQFLERLSSRLAS